jgi:hypothetical protein
LFDIQSRVFPLNAAECGERRFAIARLRESAWLNALQITRLS